MIHRMANGNGDTSDGSTDVVWWVLGGTTAAMTLYYLLKPTMQTVAPYLEIKEESFPDVNAVAVRFGQIRELWSMGYINSEEAIVQTRKLAEALLELQNAGKAFGGTIQDLTVRMDQFIKDVSEYQAQAA
jgi:hypothetical protein